MAKQLAREPDEAALYESDFYRRCMREAQLLREGRLAELDLPNLAEEIASLPDVRVFASGRGPVTLRGTTAVGPWRGNLVGRSHGPGDPHHRRVLPRGRLPPRPVPRMSAAPARPGTGPRGQRGAD